MAEKADRPLVNVSEFIANPLGVHNLESPIPTITRDEECLMGIDEAGRGPVLGPMVYGTCYCPLSRADSVKALGVADSKTLKEIERETMFRKISDSVDWLGWKVSILSPDHISNCMLRRSKYNLNELSHDTTIDLIRKVLDDKVKLTEVYVDTVGDPRVYQSKLQAIFPHLKITVTKKADSLFSIVSAASICAKVTRDACLDQWTFIEKNIQCSTEYGCGYPSDQKTVQWLKNNLDPVFGYPTLVRFSWSTCQEKLDSKAVSIKWADEEDDDLPTGYCKISNFFSAKSADGQKPAKRHRFFEEKKLKIVKTI